MIINDIIFGKTEVSEPVLIELLNAPEFVRLGNVSLAGYYPADVSFKHPEINRKVHSQGVFVLLRRFGASLNEQIAGLLHDVSHSAFSHTIDYIKNDLENQKVQGEQDRIHNQFVKNSSLAQILQKYGYDVDYILDDSNFPLKENELPDICADRLDYALRQAYIFGMLNLEQIHEVVDGLDVHNGSFVFKNQNSAHLYADTFCRLNDACWSGITSAIMYAFSAKMFRRAIECGVVELADFYKFDDNYIMAKINDSLAQDEVLNHYHAILELSPDNFVCTDNAQIEPVFLKSRVVNPPVLVGDELVRVADLVPKYREQIRNKPKFREYRLELKSTIAKVV